MADWIDDLVSKTKQKYDDRRISDQKYVVEEQQKQAAGKQFMQRLVDQLRSGANNLIQKWRG